MELLNNSNKNMTIKELIKYLEELENKDREVYFYDGELGKILTEDDFDNDISDRLDINI